MIYHENMSYHYLDANLSDGIHLLSLYCDYNITTFHEITNVSTNLSDNSTSTTTNNSTGETAQSILREKELIVDTLPPLVDISLNNQTLNVEVSDMTDTSCLFRDNALNVSFNNSLIYIFNSSSNYSIECVDLLGNDFYYTDTIIVNATLNDTNSTLNNTINEPFLNIAINKHDLNLGELGYMTINANNNSNVSLTICPQLQGWVQCYLTPTFVNETFPKTQVMPYSNKTGTYVIEAVMNYKNHTIKTNITFDVINNLNAKISATDKVVSVNDMVTFNATVTGGIGNYYYVWTMHDGQKFYGKGAYKNYTVAGEFTESLFVNDSQGNNYTASVNVQAKPKHMLTVITIDQKTNTRMKDVIVEVGDYNGTTTAAGEIKFMLPEEKYDIYASKEEYGSVVDDVNLDEDLTVYINMTFEDFTPPEITLLTKNNEIFAQTNVKLKFEADDITELRCELYVAEGNYSWFTLKDYGDNLLSDTEYTFELTDLAVGDYKWRIDCIDDNGNRAESDEYSFIVSDENVAMSLQQNDDANTDINKALDKINGYAGPEAEIVDALNIKQSLKDLLDKSNNLERDINNLAYRRDLDEQGKLDMQKKLVDDITVLQNSIPEDITVTGSRTFIKYVRDPELQELLKDYASIKSLNINTKGFFEATKRTQNKVVISTSAINAVLSYPDGTSKDITLIKKDIAVSDPSYDAEIKAPGISFVEVIPKDIAADSKIIHMVNKDYAVLKADPIIEFPSSTTTISYYINKTIDLNTLEQLDTIIIDKNVNAITTTTGFSILSADSIQDIDGKTAMIGIIVILVLIYLTSSFDILSKIKILFTNSKKKISYIRVLVNDSLDYLVTKDYDRAALIYREVKLNYESSSDVIRNEVYQECYDLCNALDAYYFNELNEEFDRYIKMDAKEKALTAYQKMEQTFEKFDEKFRKDREKIMKDSYNKISNKTG
jgi:hypothetical protein